MTPATAKTADLAAASIQDALAALDANPETGLIQAEVDSTRRQAHGHNEVAEQKSQPAARGRFLPDKASTHAAFLPAFTPDQAAPNTTAATS